MNPALAQLGSSWTSPAATADDGRGIAGTIHPVDPAAAARLRAMMAGEEKRPRPAQGKEEIIANLLKAARAKREQEDDMANTPKMTPEQARAAHERYMAGEKLADLAAELGVAWQTLQGRWQRMGLKMKEPWKKLSPEDVAEAGRRLAEGVPLVTLAREYGVDRGSLRERLEKAGLYISAKEQRRAAEAREEAEAWQEYVADMSAPALVTKNGTTPLQVVQRFDEAPLGMVATALGVLAGMRDELAAAGIRLGFRLEGAGVRVDCA